ncbi:MAG TPA: homoserine dehydrogenase [Ktedonobacteraceae bacterium]|jgi:homoserine dehydrogenase|nr:homoserine dehydrogenase [Ktedonobacteraceae bacterium]
MKVLRLSLAGFGVVGQGLVELLNRKQEYLRQTFELDVRLVGVGNGHHGFIYHEEGLNLPTLLDLGAQPGRPLVNYPGAHHHWGTILKGIEKTSAAILVEATSTNLRDAEPGLSHITTALRMSTHVVTANKGPGALAALDLLALARQQGVQLRMESTVMAGTPVLSTIREGMAGASIQSVHGILNGTTNYILTAMAGGRAYDEVLAEAQAQGYAETDPTADVEGYDALAKTLILAALVFNQPLKPEQVARHGITAITPADLQQADHAGKRIKLLGSIQRVGDKLEASVALHSLPLADPLARIDGATNALVIQSDTLSQVTITGPGAGATQTAQGLLADIIACAK